MVTRRSDRSRGTRADRYRPDLRARQITGPSTNAVRGVPDLMTVTIVELAPGFCSFDNPDVTCIATSTHEAVVAGLSEPPYTYQWSATGIAQVVSPTAQQTDVRTEAAQDIVFTLRVEVTDAVGRVAVTQVAVNHVHVGLAPDLRITQQGNRRVTQGSDRRITQ